MVIAQWRDTKRAIAKATTPVPPDESRVQVADAPLRSVRPSDESLPLMKKRKGAPKQLKAPGLWQWLQRQEQKITRA
eukprot:12983272-Heterocapsa_arctica.AAC.1